MSSYVTLLSDIDNYLIRSDSLGANSGPSFATVAQNRINRLLRIRAMETQFTATANADGLFAVPADYAELKEAFCFAKLDTGDATDDFPGDVEPTPNFGNVSILYQLERVTPEFIYRKFNQFSGDSEGKYIARSGDVFLVKPTPTDGIYLGGIYYANFAALSTNSPTNWITANAYDLLLAGTLREAAAYIKSAEQEQYWGSRFNEALAELKMQDEHEGWSGSSLQQKVA